MNEFKGEVMAAKITGTIKLFFCYAHEDEALLDKLKAYLRPLQRQGLIDVWHDRNISAGAEWEHEISEHLKMAQVILLLVSPDFMNSDYCYSVEMKRALERYERGEATVIPIILRPIYWKEAPFGKLQVLPTDGKPITGASWHTSDEALFTVAEGIRKAAKDTLKKATSKDKSGSGIQTSISQQFNSSVRVIPDTTTHSVCASSRINRTSPWRRPLIVLGSVIGLAITAFGVMGFFASFEFILEYPRSDSNGGTLGLIAAIIIICIGSVIFCKSAVAVIGRYIASFFVLLAAVLCISGFFQYSQAETVSNFVEGGVIIFLGGIFFWTTQIKKW